jgi:hypothetical protein
MDRAVAVFLGQSFDGPAAELGGHGLDRRLVRQQVIGASFAFFDVAATMMIILSGCNHFWATRLRSATILPTIMSIISKRPKILCFQGLKVG